MPRPHPEKMTVFGGDPPQNGMAAGAIFWGEIAPSEHLVHIHNSDAAFIDTLASFITSGLDAGEGVVIIATPEHRDALRNRLSEQGIDLDAAASRNQFLALDAAETLARFMRPLAGKEWPDAERFEAIVNEILETLGKGPSGKPRRVRAFGEMVALLWKEGHTGATLRLEHLWHELCQKRAFCLYCAYPRSYFTQDAEASIKQICDAHSKIIAF